MKISFENQSLQQLEKSTSTYKSSSNAPLKGMTGAYDIASSLGDSNSYEGQKKSIKDFQDSIKDKDVSVTQDYMTLMSHTLSKEDYNKMVEDGIDFSSVEAEDMVTIVDRIKMYVAKGGADIKGFTDTLSSETIEAMTGSRTLDSTKSLSVPEYDVTLEANDIKEISEAYNEISEVDEMTEGMKKLFLASDMDITVHNIYVAKHSTNNAAISKGSGYFNVEAPGYLVKKGSDESDADLAKEVTNLLNSIGEEVNEETVNQGIWLVKNSIMVTSDNMEKLNDLESIQLPISKENFVKSVLCAISEGKSPKEACPLVTENIYEEAVRITGEIEQLLSSEAVTKTRILEETRLMMTTEANLLLLKSNVSIDTKDLEAYVESLKKLEETTAYKEAKVIATVEGVIDEVKTLPAMTIPFISKTIDEITLPDVISISRTKVSFDAATEAYEQVGTEVRRDLGDSIKKAFRNVDDILSEMDLNVTDENRRAVRILGYNSISITKESVKEIREADAKLQSVLKRLTPKDTLSLIRKGSSPIEMSVKELNDYLDGKTDSQKEEIEKYSKFLYKLESEKSITQSEREAYIDVYRLIHQIEKGDLAAIGTVLNAGQELTLGNLKTAIKTVKHKGMDVTVDSSFGLLVSDIKDEMQPAKLIRTEISDETTLSALYNKLAEVETEDLFENDWNEEKYNEVMKALKAPEEVVSELVMNKVPVTPDNLEAAFALMKNRGKAFKKVNENESVDSLLSKKENVLIDAFTDKTSAVASYDEMIEEAKEKVYEEAFLQDSYVDVRELKLTHLELSLARNYSESETYEIPVTIGGETTSVNLKVVHNSKEEPNVSIVMETEGLGRVSARLAVRNEEINGYISCNLKETVTKMQSVADKLGNGVLVVYANKSDTDEALSKTPMRNNDDNISSSMLYDTAKRFLEAVKGIN